MNDKQQTEHNSFNDFKFEVKCILIDFEDFNVDNFCNIDQQQHNWYWKWIISEYWDQKYEDKYLDLPKDWENNSVMLGW